jgi:hypothetical protein
MFGTKLCSCTYASVSARDIVDAADLAAPYPARIFAATARVLSKCSSVIKFSALDAAPISLLARAAQHVKLPGAIRIRREPGLWGYTVLQHEKYHRLWPINMSLTTHSSRFTFPTPKPRHC